MCAEREIARMENRSKSLRQRRGCSIPWFSHPLSASLGRLPHRSQVVSVQTTNRSFSVPDSHPCLIEFAGFCMPTETDPLKITPILRLHWNGFIRLIETVQLMLFNTLIWCFLHYEIWSNRWVISFNILRSRNHYVHNHRLVIYLSFLVNPRPQRFGFVRLRR
jgi:hypothetical protein